MTHALRETLAAFRRAPLLTGLAAAMVALALTVVGLFALVAHNLDGALGRLEAGVEVVAWLRDEADADAIGDAVRELELQPEVATVRFVSKDSALARARRDLPDFERAFAGLEANPLPASLEIALAGPRTPDDVEAVATLAATYAFVEDVEYGRDWVERLYAVRRAGATIALLLGSAFALAAALIIGSALRIAIFARRDEIHLMRLLGARDRFVRRPFVLEGMLTGLFGAGLSLGLVRGGFEFVDRSLFGIAWLPWPWVAAGTLIGIAFGGIASALAVGRHLREVG